MAALTTEMNSSVDNPMIFSDGHLTSNSGTTSGQEIAQALELLATSMTSVAVMSERRISALLDATLNGGLPAFLKGSSPLDSGLMMAQYTAASLVAELRTRAAPASIQSIPTCANTEDHVSMSALSARHAADVADLVEHVLAIELLAACQALDLSKRALPQELAELHASLRSVVPTLEDDRIVADDIALAVQLIRT